METTITSPSSYAQSKIAAERSKQDAQWGDQSDNDDVIWLAVLAEEQGKLAQAILHTERGQGEKAGMVEHYAITTAAVATAWVEKFSPE